MSIGLLLAETPPHDASWLWSSPLITLRAFADTLIAMACLAMPVVLMRGRRSGQAKPRGFTALVILVGACGLQQVLEGWSYWQGEAWAVTLAELALAIGAAGAAVYIVTVRPRLFDRCDGEELRQHQAALAGRIEELERSLAAAQTSERMFRAFVENSSMLAWAADEDGVYRYVSEPLQRRYQHLGRMVDRPVSEVHPAPQGPRFLADNQQVLACGQPLEFRDANADGTEYQVFKFPLRDGGGRPLVAGVAFDVTEQKRIREALRQQSELYALLTDAMRIYLDAGDWKAAHGLLLRGALEQTQSQGGLVGVMVDAHRLRILAHRGIPWAELLGGERGAQALEQQAERGYIELTDFEHVFTQAVRTGEPVMVNPTSDGPAAAQPFRGFLGLPVRREKQILGLIAVANRPGGFDAATRERLEQIVQQAGVLCDSYRRGLHETALEQQLQVSQKLEAIGLLAGGVAHDFNNLLQVIQGYTNIALDATVPWRERRTGLEQVRQASERAAQLTKQLLAFSRRQNLQKVDLDLNAAIKDLLRMVTRLIGEQITVDFIPGHQLGNVHADRSQMDQVLLNLCLNARDALPNGGRITIETENVLVNGAFRESHPWAKPGRYVLATVTDNGVGMDRETMARVFEPFFTTKGKDHGTGLGLAVVYGVVQQHEGMIHVYSEPGKGTTFKIYLPIVARSASAVGPKHISACHRGTETVLLAEDDPMVRELAQRILTRAGYRVLVAGDGAEACTLFASHVDEIALVVLDMVMPQLGGREVYERLIEQRPGLPVVFCSGYAGAALGAELLGSGTGRLLAKPYGADEMLERVRQALDQA